MYQEPTAESNLERLFENFNVVTQQRNKVDLEMITNFKTSTDAVKDSLVASLFAQMNPFAPYVLEEMQKEEETKAEEAKEGQ